MKNKRTKTQDISRKTWLILVISWQQLCTATRRNTDHERADVHVLACPSDRPTEHMLRQTHDPSQQLCVSNNGFRRLLRWLTSIAERSAEAIFGGSGSTDGEDKGRRRRSTAHGASPWETAVSFPRVLPRISDVVAVNVDVFLTVASPWPLQRLPRFDS